MKRTVAAVASTILLGALTLVAAGQTDEELRQLYVRGEVAQIKKLARSGDARALAWMGRIKLQEGERGKAKEWYRRSAEKNYPPAISTLAAMHREDGECERALYWYRRGAENGNPDDQVVLASFPREGTCVIPKGEREAVR
jgi:TPR repeat protein